MPKRKYQFFENIDADGLETTLDQYGDAGWRVHTLFEGETQTDTDTDSDSSVTYVAWYSILLERVDD